FVGPTCRVHCLQPYADTDFTTSRLTVIGCMTPSAAVHGVEAPPPLGPLVPSDQFQKRFRRPRPEPVVAAGEAFALVTGPLDQRAGELTHHRRGYTPASRP